MFSAFSSASRAEEDEEACVLIALVDGSIARGSCVNVSGPSMFCLNGEWGTGLLLIWLVAILSKQFPRWSADCTTVRKVQYSI